MAKYTPGPMVASVSGSIGGTVFSRNRYGQYTRFRAVPVNPGTNYTEAAKQRLGDISGAWRNLDESDRQSWVTWAQTNTVTDPLGQQIVLQGNAAFQKLNNRILLSGNSMITLPPVGGPPPEVPSFTVEANDGSESNEPGIVTLDIDYDTPPSDATLFVWAAVVDSVGITYVKNLMKLVIPDQAPQATPDISAGVTERFGALSAGQKVVIELAHVGNETGLTTVRRRAEAVVTVETP